MYNSFRNKSSNPYQFSDTVQCCDYYNRELDDVLVICLPNPDYPICDEYINEGGYIYRLITQSTQVDCGCGNIDEVAKRLSKIQDFSGRQLALTKRITTYHIL